MSKNILNKVVPVFVGLAALVLSSVANSANMIDQNASANNTYMATFSQTDLAQSFQQSASNISGAGIFLQPNAGTSDTVTISLWSNLPNAGGSLITSASTTGTAGSWADVFWSPVAVIPNSTYYLVFTGNTTLGISGDTGNGYSRGQVYANSGYESFPTYDYTFRTYASTSPVPEPSEYALMAAGLGLMGFMVRRKKSA